MWNVLVVDDDRNITKLLDFTFQQAGFTVHIARDGSEGWAMALENPPDAAILDVMMPGMHGYELCRRLRNDPTTAHTKIVFLTARSQSIDEQEGVKAGADLFLSKPVMPEELVEVITGLLRGTKQGPAEPAEEKEVQPAQEAGRASTRQAARHRTEGRLVVCLGGCDGVGTTTIAANLAVSFSVSRQASTPLVELHSHPGNLLASLGLTAGPPFGDLQATGTLLTWDALPLHLVDHSSGVRVLPAPPPASDVSAALTNRAVSILRSRFPLVVADAASEMDLRVRTVVLSSDVVLLIATPDANALRAGWQTIQKLQSLGYPQGQILLVVNNVRPQAAVSMEEIRRGIRVPVVAVVPYEASMETMLEIGKPCLLAQPRAPTSLAIGRMATPLMRGL